MRVVGIVRWKTNDKVGNPIAGVEPLFEVNDGNAWRPVSAAEEFPTQGQVFWPFARDAVEETIVFFRAEDNRGQKDEYRVADAHPAVEVVDLRQVGDPGAVKAALTLGLRRHELRQGMAMVRCAPDVLVGPIKLVKRSNGQYTYEVSNPDRIPCFGGSIDGELRTIHDGDTARAVLPAPLGAMSVGAPTGFVDWDDDRLIVRRALTAAVTRAKRGGMDPGLTKRMIDEAAAAVTGDSGGPELELERYRLERARELCSNASYVSDLAADVAEDLIKHPMVAKSFDELRGQVKVDLEAELRAEVEASLKGARNELLRIEQQTNNARGEFECAATELEQVNQQVADARVQLTSQVADLETEISSRVAELMDRPGKALADVAILRSLLGAEVSRSPDANPIATSRSPLKWTPASSRIDDRLALQKALLSAFKSVGVAPRHAIRLHAAVVAGLLPVLSGAGALSALLSYARTVCGGRTAVVHVAPDLLQPLSLDDGKIADAASASRTISAPSLVVLEGANRSPSEAYLTPFLQVLETVAPDSDLGRVASFAGITSARPAGLRLAATAVGGAATVPLSLDLWAHAVSIPADSGKRTPVSTDPPSEVELSSELFLPAECPDDVVEEVLETWSLAREVEGGLRSYAGALARFESDPRRIKAALIEGSLLPLVAALRDDDLREQALERLQTLAGDPTSDAPPLAELEQRLRWRLA
jgi:hypothetical protein